MCGTSRMHRFIALSRLDLFVQMGIVCTLVVVVPCVPSFKVLFIMLNKVVLSFESVNEILKCDHSYESY